MLTLKFGIKVDMLDDDASLRFLNQYEATSIIRTTATEIVAAAGQGVKITIQGNFDYTNDATLRASTVTAFSITDAHGNNIFSVTGIAGQSLGSIDSDNGRSAIFAQLGEGVSVTGSKYSDVLVGDIGPDRIDGGAGGNDKLYGFGGDDRIYGQKGNDLLDGGKGNDVLIGGAGNDTYVIDSASDRIVENAHHGTDTVESRISIELSDFLENATLLGRRDLWARGNAEENVLKGNKGDNSLYGFGGRDHLSGNGGADKLYGGTGSDSLNGGSGADLMVGGTGRDRYYVDNVHDRVIEKPGQGHDKVISTVSYELSDNLEDLTLKGNGDIGGTGNDADNVITGNSGRNNLSGQDGDDDLRGGHGYDRLAGGKGDDILNGGQGIDRLLGGQGDDTYFVDSRNDEVVEKPGAGDDVIYSTVSFDLPANVETLVLRGSEAFDAYGNGEDNVLIGNKNSNHFYGSSGDDTIYLGRGADIARGGTGADQFVFSFKPEDSGFLDWITDFTSGEDTIALDQSIFKVLDKGALDADNFREFTDTPDGNDFLVFDSAGLALYYDPSGAGADLITICRFNPGALLTPEDIIVI